ncbi:MAG: tetratricopeptide repeat protein [Nocardioidaceae bacterium]
MGPMPAGTVTLLFSDIEGSTVLLDRLGQHWGEALTAQRSILRGCFAEHGGHEMGTEGDSFFVVFESTHAAVAAALAGQRGLVSNDWPAGIPVRVRMGLHAGEPQRHEDGYIGIDVHRAARIAATAHGGQIVISTSARTLLDRPPADVLVRDLGWHRLKDISEPEHLYDLADVSDGVVPVFPPLRSLGTRANLPRPPTPLIGRDSEVPDLVARFERDDARLVTLTGAGGTGKTRLAIAVAAAVEQRFSYGVFFVDLHTADRAALMWAGIAEAVDVPAEAAELPQDRVLRLLRDRTALLVLDNLEQIEGADEVVDQLLVNAPGVSVLATSRRTMHLVSEHEYPVPPMATPASDADLASSAGTGAVELFARRARMANPRFVLTEDNVADVVAVCQALDGLPLAIELAAARSRLLTPRAMVSRIDTSLGLGVSAADRVRRQRSLGDTIAWSYNLLGESDQEVFRRLGVFAGGTDLAAVEAVAGTDGVDPFEAVARLVDANLVRIVDSPDGEPHVSMLQTIRAYACQQLDASGEVDQIRLRHARWCASAAAEASPRLQGPMRTSALDAIGTVEDDVRSALDWCLRPADAGAGESARIDCGLELIAVMMVYWYQYGYVAEGHGWYERAVEAVDESVGEQENGKVVDALHGLGVMLLQQHDVAPGRSALTRALDMARRLGDRRRQAREMNSLGVAARECGELDTARSLIEKSLALARELGEDGLEVTALSNMVVILLDSGACAEAVATAQEAVTRDMTRGDRWGVAINNTNLGLALLRAESASVAYEHLSEVAVGVVEVGDPELSVDLIELFASALAEMCDATSAARLIGCADAQRSAIGIPRSEPDAEQLERSLARARPLVSPTAWDESRASGAGLTIDEAVACAVSASATSAMATDRG